MGNMLFTLPYSINEVEVAQYNMTTEQWGSAVRFDKVGGFENDPQVDEDALKSKGAMERLLSVLTHYEGTIIGAGVDSAVLNILDNTTNTLTGTAGSYIRTMDIYGGNASPYFGLIAHLPADDGSVVMLAFPFCVCTTRLNLSMEQNKFVLPEVGFKAARLRKTNGSVWPIMRTRSYEAGQQALPTNFTTFFA